MVQSKDWDKPILLITPWVRKSFPPPDYGGAGENILRLNRVEYMHIQDPEKKMDTKSY